VAVLGRLPLEGTLLKRTICLHGSTQHAKTYESIRHKKVAGIEWMAQRRNAAHEPAAETAPTRIYAHSNEYDGFLVVTKSGTDVAVRLKEYRIPFQVCEADIRELDYDLREKEFKALIEEVLGRVVLVIGDKKRLSGVVWINRYSGANKAEKFQAFIMEFFNTVLSDTTSVAFAKTRSGWRVAGYQLIEDKAEALDKHAKMLNYAFEESQGIIYSKNK
jgi:hypothetical protein